MKKLCCLFISFSLCLTASKTYAQEKNRFLFTRDWKFHLGDIPDAYKPDFIDSGWRVLNLPHDWSIELPFDSSSPTGTGGGALRGGTGWYRKTFMLPDSFKQKNTFIDFDGVYMNSEVWINGHYSGLRPNGFISFRYDLTPYLNFGTEANVIAVKVDNSQQPNSRWYSGSGIYRNAWLVAANNVFVDKWGTYITTPSISASTATVNINTAIRRTNSDVSEISLSTVIYDNSGKKVAMQNAAHLPLKDSLTEYSQTLSISNPSLWSDTKPYLYKAVTQIIKGEKIIDEYTTTFGIRSFVFDINKGFLLNGRPVKINGVCDHHDLGCLGTAINTRALERQLEILKGMGCNGIRTSHNPPAPELLDLCDKMGFIVMDEAFDMWEKQKNKYDYHLYWDEWHVKDLKVQILRDRNHPSVFIWSIGNEIPEQWAAEIMKTVPEY